MQTRSLLGGLIAWCGDRSGPAAMRLESYITLVQVLFVPSILMQPSVTVPCCPLEHQRSWLGWQFELGGCGWSASGLARRRSPACGQPSRPRRHLTPAEHIVTAWRPGHEVRPGRASTVREHFLSLARFSLVACGDIDATYSNVALLARRTANIDCIGKLAGAPATAIHRAAI